MGRALFAGMTDYSHQSFEDLVEDLKAWINSLQDTQDLFRKNLDALQKSGYWDNVIWNFKAHLAHTLKFFETSQKELGEILNDIRTNEVQQNHIVRLRSLATTAGELDARYGQIWHKEYRLKEYGNQNFALVERLYSEGRGMVQDMFDLQNVAIRLQDFVGRRGKIASDHQAEKVDNAARVPDSYVDLGRIEELKAISTDRFDLSKLIRLIEELNQCHANECVFAVAMLTRAILDHVPPIFGRSGFSEVANTYPGAKSFKQSMQNLENSSRSISDAQLHVQIRKKEALPNRTQVNFSNDLDVLLAEIVRVLR